MPTRDRPARPVGKAGPRRPTPPQKPRLAKPLTIGHSVRFSRRARNPEAFQGPAIPDDPYGRNFLELVVKTPEKTRR